MGRSRNGVSKASESSYEITFTYRGVRCRERIKLQPSPSNLKRVERHLAVIQDSIEKGTFDYAVTFPDSPRRFQFSDFRGDSLDCTDYFDNWLEEKRRFIKASTWQGYAKIVNNLIIPKFKGSTLADIKRPTIKKWLNEMACGNKRLANIQSVLRAALDDAVHDEIIESNPLYGWRYQRKEAPRSEDDVDPFTEEEQLAILSALEGQYRNFVQFAFWTGMRPSEIVALDWTDVDWARSEIRVTRVLTHAATEFEEPKTKSSRRVVKLLEPALQALTAQKQFTQLAGEEIFQHPRLKRRWTGDQELRRTGWVPALLRAGVRYRRPYQTRHTYASMMLSAGESPMWVASQMGHSDWGMIRQIYGKFIPNAIPDAGNHAVSMFGSKMLAEKLATSPQTTPKAG